MKYYKVPEKTLHWYIKDFLIYNALKNRGMYEDWEHVFDVLYDEMWEDRESNLQCSDVFYYFDQKANELLCYMEEKGLMEEIE